MKKTICFILVLLCFQSVNCSAMADGNSFFGANPSSGSASNNSNNSSSGDNTDYSKELSDDANQNAVLPGLNATTPTKPNASDFTGDEKRMQKKYKDNVAHAKQLINRGTNMMKSAHDDVNSANYKKGKIWKEIGEKWLADLNANNPFDQKNK